MEVIGNAIRRLAGGGARPAGTISANDPFLATGAIVTRFGYLLSPTANDLGPSGTETACCSRAPTMSAFAAGNFGTRPAVTLLWPGCLSTPRTVEHAAGPPVPNRDHDPWWLMQRLAAALGPRLLWWPAGLPEGPILSIASSRLGRRLEECSAWFRALRSVVTDARKGREHVIAVWKTTAAKYLFRAAQLSEVPCVVVRFGDESRRRSLPTWVNSVRTQAAKWLGREHSDTTSRTRIAFVSPKLTECGGVACDAFPDGPSPGSENIPARDHFVFAAADTVIVLGARSGGTTDRLVRQWLARPTKHCPRIHVALSTLKISPQLTSEYIALGALPRTGECEPADPANCNRDPSLASGVTPLGLADVGPEFLIHCTRRRNGPWPNQTEDEYIDDLLLSRPAADHSALASLMRIAAERRLRASSQLMRSGEAVVSFTAVRSRQLARLRTFRAHRGGWDFEPYGIALRRSWLVARGARRVIYGDEAVWKCLPPPVRPFFQPRQSVSPTGRVTDWTREREWRILGDVDLTQISRDDVILLVPTQEDARRLSAITTWPIRLP